MAAEVQDPLSLDEQVCFAMVVATRSILAVYRPILQPLGLTHPQYLVMLALWQQQRITVKGLSELLALDPGTLSPLLKRLESAGLLIRQRDPADERQLAVSLTVAGVKLRKTAVQVPTAVVRQLDIELAELRRLRGLLHQVMAAAKASLAGDAAAVGSLS
ncbi:MAG: MarR family transcriptional regulator [Actinomycetota bacterium]|nr:MarR family transcriptional regulator [Actinomycetota bacterium]